MVDFEYRHQAQRASDIPGTRHSDVSDALFLGRLVDKVVLVVRWAHTRRNWVELVHKRYSDAESNISGVLLARVDIKGLPSRENCASARPSRPPSATSRPTATSGATTLKGRHGDQANPILTAAGYSFRLVLRWLRALLAQILTALLAALTPKSALNPPC